jgi:hypothetical protein
LSVTPAQIAFNFTHSREYYANFITAAYQQYLGRNPAASEVAGWVTGMASGYSDENVEAGFIGSPEYIHSHGGSGAGWVSGMYHDLLGRTPAQTEVDGWVQNLAKGMSPMEVAHGFAASPEREGQRVTADYVKFLGRTPAASEVAGWVNAFRNGLDNESVVAGFVGSPEDYRNHQNDPSAWLTAAYNDILGRTPDADGYRVFYLALTGQEPDLSVPYQTTITINGYRLTSADMQNLEQQLRMRDPTEMVFHQLPSQLWYDSVSGAAGMMGQGTAVFSPGLSLPGVPPVPALASYPPGTDLSSTTQVYVNGRVITAAELSFLNGVVAPLHYAMVPGHHYTIQADGTAYDAVDPTRTVNLIQLANQQGHHASSGPLSRYDVTGISVLSDGQLLGVLDSGGSTITWSST